MKSGHKGQKTDAWHLVSSGRLVGWKGFSNLIEAVARLRDEHRITARLSLAGDGPERESLRRRSRRWASRRRSSFAVCSTPLPCATCCAPAISTCCPRSAWRRFRSARSRARAWDCPCCFPTRWDWPTFLSGGRLVLIPRQCVYWSARRLLKKLRAASHDPAWTDPAARHARLARTIFAGKRGENGFLDLVAAK